jgi:RNA polymerase primary sigma factor
MLDRLHENGYSKAEKKKQVSQETITHMTTTQQQPATTIATATNPPPPSFPDTIIAVPMTEREEDVVLFKEYKKTIVLNADGKLVFSDQKLRNKLATRNSKLVTYVVNKFYNKKQEHKHLRDDLLQEGQLGLLSAIDKFDPSLGWRFSTYGTLWIRQSISNYLLTLDPRVHVPSHIRTAQNKTLKKMKELGMELKDLVEDNAEELGVTPKMLNSINASLKSKWISSLNDSVGGKKGTSSSQEDSVTFEETLVDENSVSATSTTDYISMVKVVREALSTLTPREQNIILLRYDVISEQEIIPVGQFADNSTPIEEKNIEIHV